MKLFQILRKIRLDLAREEKNPPYIIFSDKVLKLITKHKPQNKEDMLEIK
jgi:ATP-dependent DNA helicase RecQ